MPKMTNKAIVLRNKMAKEFLAQYGKDSYKELVNNDNSQIWFNSLAQFLASNK